ncbi:MAG: pyridoxal phosphate-dependent aminotransferase family protein [Myxococcaceae bacterium]|nr:pyridoxal phosphate-dependent aminotransferase family protein [Myxococcaceae bacterium]
MEIFESCYRFQDHTLIKASGLYPYFRTLDGSEGPTVSVDGQRKIMMGSNNYLGLTHHPEVLRAAHEAIDRYGTSCTGSRLLNGNLDLHETLEGELARHVGKPSALVFASGFLANLGAVSQLCASQDCAVFSARDNHASLIEGTRAGKGRVVIYDGLDDLERRLSEHPRWENALVVTDAVFSMTGRVADLRRLTHLRRRFGFRAYIDDAHGIGVLGKHGAGSAAAAGVSGDIDLIFGTFSKALASMGGFVAGESAVIDYLRHKARTLIFSAALTPSATAAALAALRVMQSDQTLFDRLWDNVAFFKRGIEDIGFFTMGSTTPIIPLFIGSESLAFRACKQALDDGVFTTPVVYPAVPLGQALIRTSIMPTHQKPHLEQALDVFDKIARQLPIPKGVRADSLPQAEKMDLSYL